MENENLKKSGAVNGLVFHELLKRGYSIEGKNKVWNLADSKLWYLSPEQSKEFLSLEKKDAKQKMFVNKEIELMNQKFDAITSSIDGKNINLIDLGCGDGEKAAAFVRNFEDKSKIRYCPIDLSPLMISRAIESFSNIKDVSILECKNNTFDLVDFSNISPLIRQGAFKTNYLLLLGGNLENVDVHEVLHELRSSMKDGDILLIGNKLAHPDPAKMVEYYHSNEAIDKFIFMTLANLGFKRQDFSYSARFRGSRVEVLYTIKKDAVIAYGGRKIDFKKGDKIIALVSYKYTKDSLMEVLMMYFDDVEMFTSKDEIFSLALCKK